MNFGWVCRIIGHRMFFTTGDITGPTHCSRCPHKEPARPIKWPPCPPIKPRVDRCPCCSRYLTSFHYDGCGWDIKPTYKNFFASEPVEVESTGNCICGEPLTSSECSCGWKTTIFSEEDLLKTRIQELEEAIRKAIPLETYWLNYGRSKKIADQKPLSTVLGVPDR